MDTLDLLKGVAYLSALLVGCTWALRSKLSSIETKITTFGEKHQALEARVIRLEDRRPGGRKKST